MTGCAAPRHDGQNDPTPAEPHAHLCLTCRSRLRRHLQWLPRLWAELGELPGRGEGDGSGLPFSEPAMECRGQIRHDLTYWAMEITRIRGDDAPPPQIHGDMWSARPVFAMAGWLAGQVSRSHADPGWICYRDWAPHMAGTFADDHARARQLVDPRVVKRIEPPGDRGVCLNCPARILVTVYVDDDDPRRSFIGCPGCGERWEPEQWMSYGRQVIRRREALAS